MPDNDTTDQQPADQQPPAPPDTSATDLAAARAEAERYRQAATEAEQARQRAEADSRRQMAELATAAREALIASGQPNQPTDTDDDGIITKRELRKHMDELRTTMAQATMGSMQQENESTWRGQREINRRLAATDPSLEFYADLAPAIEAMVDRLPAKAQANPDVYRKIYNQVLGEKHKDIASKVEQRAIERYKAEQAALAASAEGDYDYEPGGEPAPAPVARREPPMPRADGSRSAVSAPGRRMPRLSDDDRFVVNRYFGGDTSAFLKAREQPDTDIFKPRERKVQ